MIGVVAVLFSDQSIMGTHSKSSAYLLGQSNTAHEITYDPPLVAASYTTHTIAQVHVLTWTENENSLYMC